MKSRCLYEKDPSYSRYGKIGVKVCDRWLGYNGFWRFLEDMGERPKGFTLDRIDNSKGYSPENCRWADKFTQANNTRRNKFFTIEGVTRTLGEWIREVDVKSSTVRQRFYGLGWTIEKSLFTPTHKKLTGKRG